MTNEQRLHAALRRAGHPLARDRGQKRSAESAPDDPRIVNTDESEVIRSPRGTKRTAEDPPDDPRLVAEGGPEAEVVADQQVPAGQPQSFRPANSIEEPRRATTPVKHMCATCGQKFESRNRLHRHLRKAKHQVIDETLSDQR